MAQFSSQISSSDLAGIDKLAQATSLERNSIPGFRLYYLLWTLIFLSVASNVCSSWCLCLSHRTFNENIIPIIAASILACTLPHYLKSAPAFSISFNRGGLLVLIVMSIFTAMGNYLHFARFSWLGFLGMSAGFIWALAGRKYFKYWLPVFLFSLELLPGAPLMVLNWLSVWLKIISMKIAISLSTLFIPITSHNNFFFVRGQAFEINTACCGLSMVAGLIFVVLLWQLYSSVSTRKVLLLCLFAIILAMVMNGVRLCATALVAYWSSVPTALAIHSNLEYILFPLALLLLWNGKRMLDSRMMGSNSMVDKYI